MTYTRTKVIACATVIEELRPWLPPSMMCEELEFGLHLVPGRLNAELKKAVNATSQDIDTIILGYGLCSMAVIGLRAMHCTMVIPRVDDCIAIFLGSRAAYQSQTYQEPGTYYLTKGWIEVGDTPFNEHARLVEQYGQERADRMLELMLNHYTRLVYIDTGHHNGDYYRDYTRRTAQKYGLRYEEIRGSTELIRKMIFGPWDEDFVVIPPGKTVTFADFGILGRDSTPPSPDQDAE